MSKTILDAQDSLYSYYSFLINKGFDFLNDDNLCKSDKAALKAMLSYTAFFMNLNVKGMLRLVDYYKQYPECYQLNRFKSKDEMFEVLEALIDRINKENVSFDLVENLNNHITVPIVDFESEYFEYKKKLHSFFSFVSTIKTTFIGYYVLPKKFTTNEERISSVRKSSSYFNVELSEAARLIYSRFKYEGYWHLGITMISFWEGLYYDFRNKKIVKQAYSEIVELDCGIDPD